MKNLMMMYYIKFFCCYCVQRLIADMEVLVME